MIKAEDLRIGDLVIVNDNCSLEQGTIGKVSEIRSTPLYKENEGSIGLKPISNDRWPWGVLCSNIDPIPLTPEILTLNGWYLVKRRIDEDNFEWHVYSHEDNCVNIQYYPQSDSFSAFFVNHELCEIKYVHDLQHILWALGEDANLTI